MGTSLSILSGPNEDLLVTVFCLLFFLISFHVFWHHYCRTTDDSKLNSGSVSAWRFFSCFLSFTGSILVAFGTNRLNDGMESVESLMLGLMGGQGS